MKMKDFWICWAWDIDHTFIWKCAIDRTNIWNRKLKLEINEIFEKQIAALNDFKSLDLYELYRKILKELAVEPNNLLKYRQYVIKLEAPQVHVK